MGRLLLTASAVMLLGSALPAQVAEKLDRGLVAVRQADGAVYVGWRLLESDPADVAFHVYRQDGAADAARRLTAEPVRESTNFVDAEAPQQGDPRYFVRAADGRQAKARPAPRSRLPARRPAIRTSPSGSRATTACTRWRPAIWTATADTN